ncbi:MAG: MBL fold metallo-hydrolase [Alphaproteobacteria bacterium]
MHDPNAKIILLGCGSSGGVPRADGVMGACDPNNPKNYRSRCSLAVMIDDAVIIIDTSPDFRLQAVANGIKKIDAVLYTHDHADQCHGIDDLRAFFLARGMVPIPAYANHMTIERISTRFDYCIKEHPFYPPIIRLNQIIDDFDLRLPNGKTVKITPLWVKHGSIEALGFRIGGMAYIPDVSFIPQPALAKLYGLDMLILDCLRYRPHPTHIHLAQSLEIIKTVNPSRAILTNLYHDLDYDTLEHSLIAHQGKDRPQILVGFDGLQSEFTLQGS